MADKDGVVIPLNEQLGVSLHELLEIIPVGSLVKLVKEEGGIRVILQNDALMAIWNSEIFTR